MPIPGYGVWAAKPISFTAERNKDDSVSPHISLLFKDGVNASGEYRAAINVKSTSSESRLVYWFVPDFRNPIISKLEALEFGFQPIRQNDSSGLALDYLRGNLIVLGNGKLLPHDVPGPNNDMIDSLDPVLHSAIDREATIYLFGSQFRSRDGIHDVHMNQGSLPRYPNGVGQDGGLILHFADDDHWEAVFLAFASQKIETDSSGAPLPGSIDFVRLLASQGGGPRGGPQGGGPQDGGPQDGGPQDGGPQDGGPQDGGPQGGDDVPVAILAALVNPIGHENQPSSTGQPETVYLINLSDKTISLDGWSISNHHGASQPLPHNTSLKANEKLSVKVPLAPLSNQGGKISLLDKEGKKADSVSYNREQGKKEGEIIYFRGRSTLPAHV